MSTTAPIIVVSQCLEFAPCRFNGGLVRSEVVRRLDPLVRFIPVCPETKIGLGVPRHHCRLIRDGSGSRFVQRGGRDLSRDISNFTNGFLAELPQVDAFLLKSGSPACALRDAPIYHDELAQKAEAKTAGVFGRQVRKRFAPVLAEDDGRLRDHRLRDSFLTTLFVSSEWRRVKLAQSLSDWRRFHEKNLLLIKVRDQAALWRMNHLLHDGSPAAADNYEEQLQDALARRPTIDDHRSLLVYVVRNCLPPVGKAEKLFFEDLLKDYSLGRVPLSVPRTVVGEWAARFEEPDLLNQSYFTPYPDELLFLADSGKDRDI